MSFCVKLSLAKKLSQALKTNVGPNTVDRIVKSLRLTSKGDSIQYSLDCKNIEDVGDMSCLRGDTQVHIRDQDVILPVDKFEFTTKVLSSSNLKSNCRNHLTGDKVIVEFSSPNIAKPFHIGHFRGTVLGNFVANLSEYFVSDVVRLNYLGDWGTPFGLIQIGLKELKIQSGELVNNPLDVLYKAYVKANELVNTNPDIQKQASDIFEQLEQQADLLHTEDWMDYRHVTVEELKVTYERLGIHFDEYHWESDYAARKISDILSALNDLPQVVSIEGHVSLPIGERNVTLLKSNGSTVYLTRDVAAAIDRKNRYHFSKMMYVTDLSQENHFKDITHILKSLGYSWHGDIEHIRYGKILGMSTREGKGVFLKDLLDEARDRMFEKQKDTRTTRISLDDKQVSDTLGTSALTLHHLKTRRMKTVTFNWDECLQLSGDGGVKLQYCHCRLVSLLQCGTRLPEQCDPNALQEPIAFQLVVEIARFHDVLCLCHEALESSILVKYLLGLTNTVNKALKQLQVKGEQEHLSQQRLLLFHNARLVLHEGMSLLGLQPLDKM